MTDEWVQGRIESGVCHVECHLCHVVTPHWDSDDFDHDYDEDDDFITECMGHLRPICYECFLVGELPADVRVEEGL